MLGRFFALCQKSTKIAFLTGTVLCTRCGMRLCIDNGQVFQWSGRPFSGQTISTNYKCNSKCYCNSPKISTITCICVLKGLQVFWLYTSVRGFGGAARYLLDNGVQYIFSQVFCQDPIEEHFGRHRSMGQFNRNPSLYEFG